jgi:trehalose synthase
MRDVPVQPTSRDGLLPALGPERHERFVEAMTKAREELDGRVFWHVNSTSQGGGVAEVLRPLVGTARGLGLDWRWITIEGSEDFFAITKRIHDHLHGSPGDGGPLSREERLVYDATLDGEAPAIAEQLSASDLVLLHDPQTLGLAPRLAQHAGAVIWRCHIGSDEPDDRALAARRFLLPSLEAVDALVFSTARHVWDDAGHEPATLIAPSIDPTTAKNQEIDDEVALSILRAAGVSTGAPTSRPVFRRIEGDEGVVERSVQLIPEEPVPEDVPLVLQVSRWDRLKDPTCVLRGFVEHVAPRSPAHLILAGPVLDGVADDPEEDAAFAEVTELHRALATADRSRVHLALLPVDDQEENAAVVNALQRRADVVVQKSLAEGFGLTVAEAMWKERSVVASAVGGIVDQVEDGKSGLLLKDPSDLETLGELVGSLLDDDGGCREMGRHGKERVLDRFLVSRELMEHVDLLGTLVG